MDIFVNNQKIKLSNKDFKTQGGEGLIYVKTNTAFKIYSDKNKVIPENKFIELSKLKHKNIIKPENMIKDTKGKNIGYTMKYVKNTVALCQLFTKAFKERHGIKDTSIKNLVLLFRDIIQSVHKDKCLIVDLNELNFLVNSKFDSIYAIDVDSYQTPSYRATAIMQNIKDRHNNDFSEETDWFSFAILTFQLFIGIHPYKGRHSKYKNLDDRMINNISVINKDVNIPKTCSPLTSIPKNWLHWYTSLFEKGERLSPPDDFSTDISQIVRVKTTIISTTNFDIVEIKEYSTNILHSFYMSGGYITILDDKKIDSNNKIYDLNKDNLTVTYIDSIGSICNIEKTSFDTLEILPLGLKPLELRSTIDKIIYDKSNVYIKNGESVYYLDYSKSINNVSLVKVANVMENSTECFGGCLIQNMLGSKFLTYFNHKESYTIKLDNLSDNIINVRKIGEYVSMILIDSNGEYHFKLLSLDKYDMNLVYEDTVTYNDLNITINDKGVGFAIIDDGKGIIFNRQNVKVFDSGDLNMSMRLFNSGSDMNYFEGNKIFKIKVK